jgi:beta-phosphoglucomutase-like phosphatase (HAD superfamily)
MKKIKAYIFDLDGTLLDSMGVWKKVDFSFLKRRGLVLTADYTKAVTPMTLTEAAKYTIERFGLDERVADIVDEWMETARREYENNIRLKPYAKEYLSRLLDGGATLAVATGLPAGLYEPALRANGIYECFAAFASTTEVGVGKSNPAVFLLAAERLGLEPSECAAFEDIYEAVMSAKSVGMTVYAMYDAASESDWELIRAAADGAFANFTEAPLFISPNS